MRVEITGISSADAFYQGYQSKRTPETSKTVVGLKGDFEPATVGHSEPGYVHGHFISDDGDFNFYFHAVQIKELS